MTPNAAGAAQNPAPHDRAASDDAANRLRHEAQAKLGAIIESSDDAIVSKTLDGIVRTWNEGARRIFGYTPEEMVGQSILRLLPPDRKQEEEHILSRLRQGERIDHFETIRVTKDGRYIDVSVTISPIRDSAGRVIGASKIARDITSQKMIQRELEAAKKAAEEASRAKDHFLSVLSHELRTPLTPAIASLELLETRTDLPAELLDELKMVRRNIETQARLVDDLLDLTRISRGKITLHFEVVDAHAVARNALAMLKPDIESKNLQVLTALSASDHRVWADAGRLQQVFLNLLSNATKFTPTGGSISVRSENQTGGRIRLEVRDTGIGLEPDLLAKVFVPFEQGSRHGTQQPGLGLGLSIAKSLIELHHGRITATSEGKNRGARLFVELPTIAGESHPPTAQRDRPAGRVSCRVLLVEDHTDTRRVMSRLLTSFGCTVESCGSVAEAIALANKQTFDLLVSDIGLPDGSGTDIMRHIRSRRGDIKGVALSGYGQPDDIRRSKEAGFDTHLIKPVNLQTLQDVVTKVAQD